MSKKQPPFECNRVYHVYHHGNAFDNLFIEEKNYDFFLLKYQKYIVPFFDTYSYCLMPNHFHLLIKAKNEVDVLCAAKMKYPHKDIIKIGYPAFLLQQFSHFLNSYASAFNKIYNRTGSLFRDGIRRKLVSNKVYFMETVRYIHLNAVHHGFTTDHTSWPYSSYHILLKEDETWLKRKTVIDVFGGVEGFINFHKDKLKKFDIEE